MALLSYKVTGRGPCQSRDLLAKIWTLSEGTPLPSLRGCLRPSLPGTTEDGFPLLSAALSPSCVACDFLWSTARCVKVILYILATCSTSILWPEPGSLSLSFPTSAGGSRAAPGMPWG